MGRGRRRQYPRYPYYDGPSSSFSRSCCADLKYGIIRCDKRGFRLNGAQIDAYQTRYIDGELWVYVEVPDQPLVPGGGPFGWMLVCNIQRPRLPGLQPLMMGRRRRGLLGG